AVWAGGVPGAGLEGGWLVGAGPGAAAGAGGPLAAGDAVPGGARAEGTDAGLRRRYLLPLSTGAGPGSTPGACCMGCVVRAPCCTPHPQPLSNGAHQG